VLALPEPIALAVHLEDVDVMGEAVDYLRDGGSIYDLQQILGHASIKTTEIYLAFLTPAEQRVSKRLGANADGT
jgi:integrase